MIQIPIDDLFAYVSTPLFPEPEQEPNEQDRWLEFQREGGKLPREQFTKLFQLELSGAIERIALVSLEDSFDACWAVLESIPTIVEAAKKGHDVEYGESSNGECYLIISFDPKQIELLEEQEAA